ncbi:hypothetical protein [Burkholderia ubonensis]|nr:hypothetical protein [Burkholderia ubonensis]
MLSKILTPDVVLYFAIATVGLVFCVVALVIVTAKADANADRDE